MHNGNPIKSEDGNRVPPLPKPHDVPPHILKEIFDLKEKVGRLEGKVEVLLHLQPK